MPEDGSFGRQNRLLTARDYQNVFTRNRKRGNASLLVLVRANEQGFPRLGLAIAKKHLKRAVDRNRVKRLIREYFRHRKTEFGGNDIIVLSRAGCQSVSGQELVTSLDDLCFKLMP